MVEFNGNKKCLDCGNDIEPEHQFGGVKYCKKCAYKRLMASKKRAKEVSKTRYTPKSLFEEGKSEKFNSYFKYVKKEIKNGNKKV